MKRLPALLGIALAATALCGASPSKRLVIIKVDGLPASLVEHYLSERDALTGKSRLPWIDRIFRQQGTCVENFYVRGISLSAPSWSMLDTGQHAVIHGNAEYDRYTLRTYDYLNFFPFYVNYARSKRVDMPGVEVLDDAGVPLLIDRYKPEQRYQSVQLLQRGVLWKTLQGSIVNRILSRTPGQLFNEWQLGFEMGRGVSEQIERELMAKLRDPNVMYLDYFLGDYDHVAHLTNDPASQYAVLKRLDGLTGRLWAAIQASPLAQSTVLVLVSDHGMNSDPNVYSQGYSLLNFFESAEGGGHHVLTNRHPMTEYKLKGLDPFVSNVITPSARSYYLRDQADEYPTALLDLDGNERASVQLRNNRLNEIHILLQQLSRRESRAEVQARIFGIIDGERDSWNNTLSELKEELAALHRRILQQVALVSSLTRKWSRQDRDAGLDREARREAARLRSWQEDETGYSEYARVLSNLLRLEPAQLDPGKLRIESLIPKRAMGAANTIYDLQNYAIGPAEHGFRRVNYFELLTGIHLRNNVQEQVGTQPVDFIAVHVPRETLAPVEDPGGGRLEDGVWIYGSDTNQALILVRHSESGLEYRYMPVKSLTQDRAGHLHFTPQEWREGRPLHLWEDPELHVPGSRAGWLNEWHGEREWFQAVHRTEYSNAIIGLPEQLSHALPLSSGEPKTSDDLLLRRFEQRRHNLAQADMLVLASNHWNFNVRGFNPGGNHGSFFRMSTRSVLMLAGSGVPEGFVVEQPYDSLSFVPTVLALAGAGSDEFKNLPGPVIRELTVSKPPIAYNCCR